MPSVIYIINYLVHMIPREKSYILLNNFYCRSFVFEVLPIMTKRTYAVKHHLSSSLSLALFSFSLSV